MLRRPGGRCRAFIRVIEEHMFTVTPRTDSGWAHSDLLCNIR